MIKVLDQNVIDKIAAGEVVERPKSIVKELVENSIDAGATRITVEIRDGGKEYIRVTDNGCGIPGDEIRLACERHATSKLTTADELSGIATLGFRGEALSTISAVTETEIITKTADSSTGIKYIVHGGKEIELSETGAPNGTTIISRNIFFNTTPRLKFLKTGMTEGSYINDIMTRFALSSPDISFKLISNNKTVLDTSGNGKLKDVIYSIYGKDITKNLLEVDYTDGEISINGYVGKPFVCKGNRSFETYFVNGRYISSGIVFRAIEEAYKTFIMQHKFPFTVLNISLPGKKCDVNVHPSKQEFKYEDEKGLFSAVYHAVSDALKEKEHIPEFTATYDKPSTPAKDKPVKSDYERPVVSQFEYTKNSNDNTSRVEETAKNIYNQSNQNNQVNSYSNHVKQFSIAEKDALKKTNMDSFTILNAMLPPEFRKKLDETQTENSDQSKVNSKSDVNSISAPAMEPQYSAGKQQELTDDNYLSKEALPKHKIIGLAFNTYWITEYMDDLYLMDQHAAHEKVNYERFMKEFKERNIVSQNLYPPMVISLSPEEKAACISNMEYFEKSGFEISDFGDNEVRLSAVPVNLVGLEGRDVFLEFAAYLASDVSGVTEDIFVHKIATMGCKAAVKGNQHISVVEVQALIDELMTLENPYTCPHGRPTLIKFSKSEIDKKFKRIV